MVPNKDTVGTLGEVLVDNDTGFKYKCAYICKTTNDKGVYYTYEWERIYSDNENNELYAPIRVNVDDFGADPTGEDDSIEAINNAIDFAVNNDIQYVVFPKGRYKITTTLRLKSGISYISDDPDTTIFIDDDYIGTSEGIITNNNSSNIYDENTADSFNIENISFLYDSDLSFSSKTMLLLRNVNNIKILNCKFLSYKKFIDSECELTNVDLYAGCKNVRFEKCVFELYSDTNAGGNIWVRNFDTTNTTKNIIIDGCSFTKKTHDEMIAVFTSTGGNIANVKITNNTFNMLDSTSVSPICFSFRASNESSSIDNVLFENNDVNIENYEFMVFQINDGVGKLSNCFIKNNLINAETTSSQTTYIAYAGGNNYNTIIESNMINSNSAITYVTSGESTVSHNVISGNFTNFISGAKHVENNVLNSTSTNKVCGIINSNTVLYNTINNVETGIKLTNASDASILICNNEITLCDHIANPVAFMCQHDDNKRHIQIIQNKIIVNESTTARFIWLSASTDMRVCFYNNTSTKSLTSYTAGALLYEAYGNLFGSLSDTYCSGVPNYRFRDILPIGHRSFDRDTLTEYIKISNEKSNDAWMSRIITN